MRISDWSSDVCSSDLVVGDLALSNQWLHRVGNRLQDRGKVLLDKGFWRVDVQSHGCVFLRRRVEATSGACGGSVTGSVLASARRVALEPAVGDTASLNHVVRWNRVKWQKTKSHGRYPRPVRAGQSY